MLPVPIAEDDVDSSVDPTRGVLTMTMPVVRWSKTTAATHARAIQAMSLSRTHSRDEEVEENLSAAMGHLRVHAPATLSSQYEIADCRDEDGEGCVEVTVKLPPGVSRASEVEVETAEHVDGSHRMLRVEVPKIEFRVVIELPCGVAGTPTAKLRVKSGQIIIKCQCEAEASAASGKGRRR